MTISMIRAQNPQGVVDGGVAQQAKADALDATIRDQVHALNRLRENWQGKAANAAIATAYRNIQAQYLEHEKLAALAKAMQSGGSALATFATCYLAGSTRCRRHSTSPTREW